VTRPILIFGWGNPSRGDDALGPLFVERIAALNLSQVECLTDFQLQVEHALDLEGRRLVVFVDASLDADPPFTIDRISPAPDASISTHAVNPQAVMQVYVELQDKEPPPCFLLAMCGEDFQLGSELSPAARKSLEAACEWATGWLGDERNLSTFPAKLS
jgi:hydrogenase maturation protease